MDLAALGIAVAKIGLPLLGAVLPIPGGAAIGMALASHIGSPSSDPADILATLTQTAESLQKAHEFELTHQATMLKLKLDADQDSYATEVDDRKDARAKFAENAKPDGIAVLVLATFALTMAIVLYGCWSILSGGITIKDVAVVAAISGLVGSIVGYFAANAQTVLNFRYGGSMGGDKHATQLANGFQASIVALSNRQQAAMALPAIAAMPVQPVTPTSGVAGTESDSGDASDTGDGPPSPGAQGPIYSGGS